VNHRPRHLLTTIHLYHSSKEKLWKKPNKTSGASHHSPHRNVTATMSLVVFVFPPKYLTSVVSNRVAPIPFFLGSRIAARNMSHLFEPALLEPSVAAGGRRSPTSSFAQLGKVALPPFIATSIRNDATSLLPLNPNSFEWVWEFSVWALAHSSCPAQRDYKNEGWN